MNQSEVMKVSFLSIEDGCIVPVRTSKRGVAFAF